MTYSREAQDRIKKIETLKNANIVPYANNYRGKQDIKDILDLSKQEGVIKDLDVLMKDGIKNTFQTAGRVMLYRSHGKLAFAKIIDSTSEIQVCFLRDKFRFNTGMPKANNQDDYKIIDQDETINLDGFERTTFKIMEKYIDRGDYIGVKGDLFLTKHKELTLLVSEVQILSKAVRPLPEKFHGVVDQETIYRKRYLDLVTNNESYDKFTLKSRFIKTLRDFYHKKGFTEILTPILGNSASGAAAQPFITHHNDYGEDVFLRIAPEIGLKMATAGRFEKVFEFGPNFRNEGSDPSHMQEFHVVEHYAAYWNFEDNIKFTEEMFDYFFNELNLERKIPVRDKEGNKKIVDFTTPFKRIDYVKGVNNASGLDITKYKHGDEKKLIKDIKAKGISFEGMENMAVPTLIDYLYKKVLRPSIVQPSFVYNYPKALQPLARQNDINTDIVEQFQLVVNGWEINKAYSELIDPKIQSQNFNDQSGAIELGDEEATQGDDEFVTAMEYGMPCQSGFGMGFDRIFSILTQQDNLRDVVLFPLMKEEKKAVSKKELEKIYRAKKVVIIADQNHPSGLGAVANAIGQLGIEIGGHSNEKLFEAKTLFDKEGRTHYADCFYGMSNLNGNQEQMADFVMKCYNAGIQVFDFSDIMRKAHHDEDMIKGYKTHNTRDIGYIAVGAIIPSDFEKEFLSKLGLFGK